MDARDDPLRVTTTEDGRLIISVGLDILTRAIDIGLERDNPPLEISDEPGFLRDFVLELLNEGEQEESRLGRFFDSVAESVVDGGSLTISEKIIF
jgi:hypothetical protein